MAGIIPAAATDNDNDSECALDYDNDYDNDNDCESLLSSKGELVRLADFNGLLVWKWPSGPQ